MPRIPTVEIEVNGRRKIVNADDPRAQTAPEAVTPESIAKMKKADVTELLEAHGADAEGKLPELRARLIAIMFVDA